ncbi:MAG: T9SS type A sorting domain-containing protein, partial [Crocinitomicaceae bacterium]|nr:T9SS type A sorting domain-containing protein [Crocinitomicaceae bacterium]
LWVKVNTSIITGTSYSDNTIPSGGDFEFMVKSVKLKNNSSGSFYNESLGTTDTEMFSVGISDLEKSKLAVYPNPSNGVYQISAEENIESYKVFDSSGKLVLQEKTNSNFYQLDMTSFNKGLYSIQLTLKSGASQVKKVIIK